MQATMNLKIKFRESFRPFAPCVLRERAAEYFEMSDGQESPYMLLVAGVRERYRLQLSEAERQQMLEAPDLRQRVNLARSTLPAITHVDYSARVQTVNRETNPGFHAIIKAFERLTGYGVVINTSFNVRGEPIVCTPEDAYRCFMRTEMDVLVLGACILRKKEQPVWTESGNWRVDYVSRLSKIKF